MAGNMYRVSAAAAVALAVLVGGCSSDTGDSGAKETVTVTASASTVSASTAASETPTSSAAPTAESQSGRTVSPADFPDRSGFSFASPNGRVVCRAIDRDFICQTPKDYHAGIENELCGFYPDEQGYARQFGYFFGRSLPCATSYESDDFQSPHTLAAGDTLAFELYSGVKVTCVSQVDGVTCTDSKGSGFAIATKSFQRTA